GAPGQLYIEGSGLAYGYVGRSAATAERFVPNPFGAAGSRLYASGDLCRRDIHGQLLFLGRSDRQVKLNGHRIELGEIEKALLGTAGVRHAAAGVQRRNDGNDTLYACVAADAGVSWGEVQADLRTRLPAYLVPARILIVAALPLSVSGKVDHAAILSGLSDQAHVTTHRPPETALERVVAALWEEQFGYAQVGLDDEFFAIGGHSIAAIRFIARFNAIFRTELGLVVVLDAPRLRDFCAAAYAHAHDPQSLERDAQLLVKFNTE
uniref:phosphopantetheine-binding protein n=1 Tax=Xanthomonas melonis TaxID=56456 RepID=UPI003EB6A95F